MAWPILVVNLKQHIVGTAVHNYIKAVAPLTAQYAQPIIICPAIADLDKARAALPEDHHINVFSQKIDNVEKGQSKTGTVCVDSITPLAGTLLNHYEARIYGSGGTEEQFNELITTAKKAFAKSLAVIFCADTAETGEKIARAMLNYPATYAIAVEWDAFIGQRISMVKEKPEEIKTAIQKIKAVNPRIPVYAGAGVEDPEDIVEVLKMGGAGALAATGFTKAPQKQGSYTAAIEGVLQAIKAYKETT